VAPQAGHVNTDSRTRGCSISGRLTSSLSGRLLNETARHARTIVPACMACQFSSHGRSKRWLDGDASLLSAENAAAATPKQPGTPIATERASPYGE
jgi:hypothetical protein